MEGEPRKGRGRPKKFASDVERDAHIKAYRQGYYKDYYQGKKEIICERQRRKYAEGRGDAYNPRLDIDPRIDLM